MVEVKRRVWGRVKVVLNKGLEGIIYDHNMDHLLACDAHNNRIIKVNPTTGTNSKSYCCFASLIIYSGVESMLCALLNPFQITQSAPEEYLVTSTASFIIYKIVKEGILLIHCFGHNPPLITCLLIRRNISSEALCRIRGG